jgi:H+/Cl- antiporter ClcA
MQKRNKYLLITLGVVLGAIAGFVYWKFFGCTNGCPIKSIWWRMTLWGALMGGLIMSIISDYFFRKEEEKN